MQDLKLLELVEFVLPSSFLKINEIKMKRNWQAKSGMCDKSSLLFLIKETRGTEIKLCLFVQFN